MSFRARYLSTMTTALVTGASSGIGAATARALSAAGHVVIAAARRRDALVELCESLSGPSLAVVMDITDPASISSALEEARAFAEAHGGIEWLVNNAIFFASLRRLWPPLTSLALLVVGDGLLVVDLWRQLAFIDGTCRHTDASISCFL